MNILLLFPGFIVALIIVFCYECKIRNLSAQLRNKVRFYVARDVDSSLFLYLGKPQRDYPYFIPKSKGKYIAADVEFEKFNLEIDDFENLKWEDEPVEVFINMED